LYRNDEFRAITNKPEVFERSVIRLGDVLDFVLAHRLEAEGDFVLDLVVDIARDADPTRRGQLLEARGDVDATAVDIVALNDDVADVDADPEGDAPVVRHLDLALGDTLLDRGGAFDRIDHAPEFDQRAVAHQLDDAAVVLSDFRLDEVLAQRLQARVCALLVGRHEARVADDVGGENGGQPTRDGLPSAVGRIS
jgi:hypothetical protein